VLLWENSFQIFLDAKFVALEKYHGSLSNSSSKLTDNAAG